MKKELDIMRKSKNKKTLDEVLNENHQLDEAVPKTSAGTLERELTVVYSYLAEMKKQGGNAWGVASLADKKTAQKIKKINSDLDSLIKDIRKQIGK